MRRPPAWTVTALPAIGHLTPAPRPRGRELSQPPLLRIRLHDLGQLLVRRPPPARLLAARPRARRRDRARGARRALDGRRDGAVRDRDRRALPAARGACRRAV